MGLIITTYCQVSEVDAYAKQFGKTVWQCLGDEDKKSFVERANRQIHAWHGQAMLWQAGEFNFPCVLQSIYVAKNFAAMDLAEIANNSTSGSYGDSINSVEAGAEVQFDDWAMRLMQRVMDKQQVNRQPRFAHG